jgi:ribosomal protein S18 acetylase RimI-like enzyme
VDKVEGWDEAEQRRLHEQRFGAQRFRIITLVSMDVGIMATAGAPDCVKLNQLFVLPAHQGKGIGRRCMSLVMGEELELGVPVQLHVMKVNPRALAFYQRLGFVRIGESDTHDLLEWAPLGSQPEHHSHG